MTEPGRGAIPLLLAAATAAVGLLVYVLMSQERSLPLRLNTPAPEFSIEDLSGQPLGLGELRGRVVFVNFWATFCAPCKTEAPSLERLYQELGPEGFEIVALSIDKPEDREEVEKFKNEFELSFRIGIDSGKIVYDSYQATGVPETFIRQGRVCKCLTTTLLNLTGSRTTMRPLLL